MSAAGLRVIVGGALANKPGYGGEAWVRLEWARGLAALGAEVWFVEQLRRGGRDRASAVRFFEEVCARHGLTGRCALLGAEGRALAGAAPEAVADFAADADLLVNLSGHLTWEPVLSGVRRRAYVDLDPGFTQFWHAAGSAHLGLERHDRHFTVGENVGTPGCAVPTGGFRWLPARQPVVLEEWPACGPPERPRFTTVASWRGAFGPVEFGGRRYGLKVHEFRRFAGLPGSLGLPAEIALDIDPADARDRRLLERAGWSLVDPARVAATPDAFRDYVQGSAAELSVAQGVYVETGGGWFSDRSARYLASGRPVVVQDTGFGRALPTGEGLFAFRTPAEAAAAARAVEGDLARHGRAARALAEEHFDARKVLHAFLERALDGAAPRPPHPASASTPSARPPAPRPAPPPVVVSGMVAGVPGQGGATWAVLQYVLGLLRLGRDVHLVEELPAAAVRPRGETFERSDNARYFGEVARTFGLEGRATLLLAGTERTVGLPYAELARVCGRAGALLNLSGTLTDRALLERVPARVYVDLDPAFTQLWQSAEGLDMRLDSHSHFATVGLEIGAPGCTVPTCGVDWIPTLPPVALRYWRASSAPGWRGWTTVAHWRGYGAIQKDGTLYGQKAHAFRPLYPLPLRTGARFEVALGIHEDERDDLRALRSHRWRLLDPRRVAGDARRYRDFVSSSSAEVGIAKTGYVASRCGWFSDRSACYLAAGRPVLAQDTGFSRHLPTGFGLLAFGSLEEAAEEVARVEADHRTHARAARRIAEEYLDSDRVLPRLLERVGA